MGVICPYCGNVENEGDFCGKCQHNIKWVAAIYHKSRVYYQKGYELACEKKLTQAVAYLQKAIEFNKYNVDAQNLLGLVYYELGDIGNGLKAWILSTSVEKDNNLASGYLDDLHQASKLLEHYKQAIKLYNQAVMYLKNKNEDMAIIRLKKCIQIHPAFIEARNLLALAYMLQEKYTKAMEQIKEVLSRDVYNDKALRYLKDIQLEDVQDRSAELVVKPKRRVIKEYAAHKVINRGHVLGTAIIYFVFGLVCMFGIEIALILPSKTEALELQLQHTTSKAEEDLNKLRSSLEEASTQITTLKDENKKITAQKDELQNMNSKLAQQNRINAVLELKSARQWTEGAEILYRIAPEQLEPSYKKQYDELITEIYPKAADEIYADGLGKYNSGEYVEAFAEFEKVQLYVPKSNTAANSLYYMGMIEEKNNQIEKAVQYYETISLEYEGTSAYYRAKERLKKIVG